MTLNICFSGMSQYWHELTKLLIVFYIKIRKDEAYLLSMKVWFLLTAF